MRRVLSGRVAIDPIPVPDRRAFIDYLERNAARIDSAFKLQIPLLSRKKGYVFFEDEKRILIRYNSEKPIGFTSLCFLSAKVESDGARNILRGSYRFPTLLEFPKYFLPAFAVIWIFYFGYLVISGSPKLIEDTVVFVLGLLVIGAGAAWFGNVSASFFARNTMKKVGELLAQFSKQQ